MSFYRQLLEDDRISEGLDGPDYLTIRIPPKKPEGWWKAYFDKVEERIVEKMKNDAI